MPAARASCSSRIEGMTWRLEYGRPMSRMNHGALWTGIVLLLYVVSSAPVEAWYASHPKATLVRRGSGTLVLSPQPGPGAPEMPEWVRKVYAPVFWLARQDALASP